MRKTELHEAITLDSTALVGWWQSF